VKRREFITLLGGAAVAWPLVAHAQQPERMRRIGVLMGLREDDLETKSRLAKLRQELERLGWSEGSNLQRSLDTFARQPDGGLLLPPDATTLTHRDLVIALAARHRLPGMYAFRVFVIAGGLMYYGTNQLDMFGQTASYIDRILRGARPADLPVQAPTKYETVLNLRTAKTLGLPVPPGLLVAADEVIE
jgi:putative tryptophan/tyrosine transport system substrate-binding protein